ncbi:MAG: nucleotidyltransferase domain-containing protein [Acidobacteria bacterium]|nr:nucleotidyltransferase domain-containing protein [Spirochaetota bacterium]MBE3134006.1 nucleotidyltransferase domain-containing protein [Acidobacteriota bacterium]
MPVRSLSSSVLAWPKKNRIESALKDWALELGPRSPDVLAIGYFGSYARGDWGVGSDLDLLVVVDQSDAPFERRGSRLRTESLPVPVDPLIYTRSEITEMFERGGRFPQMLRRELRWVWKREGSPQLTV